MTASAKAKRIAESKIITAEAEIAEIAEIAVAEKMKKVAELMDSSSAMQMRYNETLIKICEKSNLKILLIPDNIMGMSKMDPEYKYMASKFLSKTMATSTE